jgi:hypothetical protein
MLYLTDYDASEYYALLGYFTPLDNNITMSLKKIKDQTLSGMKLEMLSKVELT